MRAACPIACRLDSSVAIDTTASTKSRGDRTRMPAPLSESVLVVELSYATVGTPSAMYSASFTARIPRSPRRGYSAISRFDTYDMTSAGPRRPVEYHVVIRAASPTKVLARLADEPQPRVREPSTNVVPQCQQMIDVEQRIVSAPIAVRQQPGGDIADDDFATRPLRSSDPRYTRFVEKVQAHRLGNNVVRLLESQHLQLSSSRLRRHNVRRDVGPAEERGFFRRHRRVVDVHHDLAAEPGNLSCAGAEGEAIAAVWQRRAARDVGSAPWPRAPETAAPRTIRGPEQIAR